MAKTDAKKEAKKGPQKTAEERRKETANAQQNTDYGKLLTRAVAMEKFTAAKQWQTYYGRMLGIKDRLSRNWVNLSGRDLTLAQGQVQVIDILVGQARATVTALEAFKNDYPLFMQHEVSKRAEFDEATGRVTVLDVQPKPEKGAKKEAPADQTEPDDGKGPDAAAI